MRRASHRWAPEGWPATSARASLSAARGRRRRTWPCPPPPGRRRPRLRATDRRTARRVRPRSTTMAMSGITTPTTTIATTTATTPSSEPRGRRRDQSAALRLNTTPSPCRCSRRPSPRRSGSDGGSPLSWIGMSTRVVIRPPPGMGTNGRMVWCFVTRAQTQLVARVPRRSGVPGAVDDLGLHRTPPRRRSAVAVALRLQTTLARSLGQSRSDTHRVAPVQFSAAAAHRQGRAARGVGRRLWTVWTSAKYSP